MSQDFYSTNGAMAPVIITENGTPKIENSELRKIASDALAAAKYAFVSVAANPDQVVRPESLEAVFQESLGRMKAAKRERIGRQAHHLAGANQEVREMLFGRYGRLTSQAFLEAGFDQAQEKVAPLPLQPKLLGIKTPEITVPLEILRETPQGLLIPKSQLPAEFNSLPEQQEKMRLQATQSQVFNPARLQEIWGPVYKVNGPKTEIGDSAGIQSATIATTGLSFNITLVKCSDETNPEWPGDDEISLASVSIDETGETKKISSTVIGNSFDDGDQKLYNPHWQYHYFSLAEGQYWPKAYAVNLILAETDNGGLSEALDKVWAYIDDLVKREIEKAVTGALQEFVGPAIAAAIGKAAAWVADQLVGWLIDIFKDDLFPVYSARLTIPNPNARWYYPDGRWGNPVSPLQQAHFYGHGGHYYIEYYWKLS